MTLSSAGLQAHSAALLIHLYHEHLQGRGHADTLELAQALALPLPTVALLCRRLVSLGQLHRVADRGGDELLVQLTSSGVQAAEAAQNPAPVSPAVLNIQMFDRSQVANQFGAHSVQHITQGSALPLDLQELLTRLRREVRTLPAADQDEAQDAVENLETGVKLNRMDRATRALKSLQSLGESTSGLVSTAVKIGKVLGLDLPGSGGDS